MTAKIFRSILLTSTVALLSGALLIMAVLYGYFSDSEKKTLKNGLNLAAAGVENEGLSYLKGLPTGDFRFTYIDVDGRVLYDSAVDAASLENHADRTEVADALESGSGESVHFSKTLTAETVYVATRLSDGKVLRIAEKKYTPFTVSLGILQPVIVVLFVVLVLAIVLAERLAGQITKPLNSMDLSAPKAAETYPELSPLLSKLEERNEQIGLQQEELRRQQEELDLTESKRQEFTGNVSHELKTPLQSIMGNAELIEEGLVKKGDIPKAAGKIRKEANRLLSLINDLIDLSRLDAGREEDLKMAAVDLYEAAAAEIAVLSGAAEKAAVTVDLRGDHCRAQGVDRLVHQLVYNLLDNAIRYNVPGGKVTVSVAEEGGRPALSVADTGIGIPAEHQDRIFERFYRVDKSRSRQSGGTGLGLSIVKHAALDMNAKIDLESVPGKGTEIRVLFQPAEG